MGKRYTVSSIKNREIKGSAYYILVGKTDKSINKNKASTIDYDGIVWCLKIKDNKNFIVERNGRLDFCGNTDEVYGSISSGSFKEEDPLRPSSPYAASKAAADVLVHSYFVTYGLPVLITRSTNNFGPYQHPEKLIPKLIINAISGKPLPIYGDGKNVRDWLYVIDNCEAIDLILGKGKGGEVYNVGAGNERRNLEIATLILRELGKPRSLIKFVEDRPGHDFRYSLNCEKIMALGWKPEHSFGNALKETINWYKNNEWWWNPLLKKQLIKK
jgi:dTDP-glucose 4,6-dehydratase